LNKPEVQKRLINKDSEDDFNLDESGLNGNEDEDDEINDDFYNHQKFKPQPPAPQQKAVATMPKTVS
jgi:hypothetical protein